MATTSTRSTMPPRWRCWLTASRRWPLGYVSVFWPKRRVTRSPSWNFRAALTGRHGSPRVLASPTLPLSQRLQEVFAARITGLPVSSRYLLLLAVLEGTGDLAILQSASGQSKLEGLGPAERARLVRVDRDGRLTFRHPLTRSAVTELSTSSRAPGHAPSARAVCRCRTSRLAPRRGDRWP